MSGEQAKPMPCPTRVSQGHEPYAENDVGGGLVEYLVCPDCDGTGHPSVAQVLAWGEAVATADQDVMVHVGDASLAFGSNRRLDALRAVRP